MQKSWQLNDLTAAWEARGLDRRDLFKLVGSGATLAAIGQLTDLAPLSAAAAAQEAGSQVSVLWAQPVILSPLFSTSGSEQQIQRLMFGTLVKMAGDLTPTPDLAETIEVSEDATEYTFTLREGITFTDGTPLTANDAAFTLTTALNPLTGSYWQGRLAGIAGAREFIDGDADSVSGIEVVDDLTLKLTMAAPDSAFLPVIGNFAGLGILPQHILGDVAPDQLREHPYSMAPDVTAGAYKFVQFLPEQYLEVEANPDYVGGVPAIERIFLRIVTPTVGVTQLETGEMDLMSLPVAEAERVRTLPNITVTSVPSPSMDFLAMNLTREALQDLKLRQAMITAIDRQGIVNSVLQGEGEVVNSSIFGPEWMGTPEGLNEYAFDVEAAKALLAESTYDGSTLQIMHLPDQGTKDAVINIVQEQWRTAGINTEILQVDVAELQRRYNEENDFDIFYNAGGVFRADPNISGTYFLTRNFTPAGGNGSHYSNERVDELFAAGQATVDQAERKAAYTELAQILNADLPWIFLWSPNSIYAQNNRLQGFEAPSYSANKFWNAEDWTLAE